MKESEKTFKNRKKWAENGKNTADSFMDCTDYADWGRFSGMFMNEGGYGA